MTGSRNYGSPQNTYLEHFSRIGTFSSAARETGVTVYKAQTWKFNNVLGFARRLEVATLMFNDRLKEKALRRASDPKAPVTLLIELLRAYIPEEFSRNGHKCDTSKSDEILRRFREDAQREKDAGYPRLRKLAEGATNAHPHDDHVPSYSNLSPAEGEIHNTNLSPGGGETQRGGSLHTDPHAHQPSHEPTSANRHTGGDRYPVDVPTRLIGPNQTQNAPKWPDPHEGPHHDDNPPLDTAESNLSPAGGEIQRGGASRAERREQLRQQRKAEKKNTFPVVRF